MNELSAIDVKIAHLENLRLWSKPKTPSVLDICEKLGYIQLDTISVVARSQDLVCHTRSIDYGEKNIWKYLENGKLFEGFAHARCLLPMENFPYHFSKMLMRRANLPRWSTSVNDFSKWAKQIIDYVDNNGEVTTKDIPVPDNFPSFTGWNSPSKRMLDYLFTRGYLLVKKREKFQLVYDLPDRVVRKLPSELPNRLEIFWHDIKSTLIAIGPSMQHRLLHYKYTHRSFEVNGKKYNPRVLIKQAVKDGDLVTLNVEGHKEPFYYLPELLPSLEDIPTVEEDEAHVFLLSPFDNVLWSRESLLAQYQYDYKMEVYVPKRKRKFGYFAMPILWGHKFIGRVDTKFDRKSGEMQFIQWTWEKKFKENRYFWKALASTLNRFASFHGASKISLGDMSLKNKERLSPELAL
ncbi:MAG: DNA glycosylase AlkZ-like family protein [Candidatus Kariarchaeaceae archaeon]